MFDSITLNLGGKDIEFKFGLGFLGELLDETGLTIVEIVAKMNQNPFLMIPVLMVTSAAFSAHRNKQEFTYDKYDFSEWIDADGGINSPSAVKFLEAFTKSLTKDVPKTEEVEETTDEPKKK